MSLDLHRGARSDERFHLQSVQPTCEGWGVDWCARRVTWHGLTRPDGAAGAFSSVILLWFLRWYWGTVKVDASRTFATRHGHYGEVPGIESAYVMTTTPKELLSVRLRWHKPDREVFTNMGGI